MKVSVIGHFAYGKNCIDGQTVKTHVVTSALKGKCDEIITFDTHNIKKKIFKLPFMLRKALKGSDSVVILPAHNGVRIIVPLLCWLNKRYHRKLHYSVVGGWLPSFLNGRKKLEANLKKFDGIYVETQTMVHALEERGFENVYLTPNFKDLERVEAEDLAVHQTPPYKLCIFSRVSELKGISDAVEAIKKVNESFGEQIFALDIYGPVAEADRSWFDTVSSEFPSYVEYKGVVPFDESVKVLKNYFALLFPTKSFTEGVPGTIIDAYAAGVPVISSKWESFSDVVEDGITGIGYEFGNLNDFISKLSEIAKSPEIIDNKRNACLIKARDFTSEVALKELLDRI